MDKTMTPSAEAKAMTEGQIAKAVANYRALLEKHAPELDSQAVQIVLGQPDFAAEQLAVLRRRVESISKMVVRSVKVNRTLTPQEAIHATKRAEYLNDEVVNGMPHGTLEEVEVCFFPLEKFTSVADVQQILVDRGLEPDPQALAAVNEADPVFADSHPNGTQWVDGSGKHCYLAFRRWYGERLVDCDRGEFGWSDRWWIGGVRKQSSGA